MTSPRRNGIALGAVRLCWAAALLSSPGRLVAMAGGEDTPTSRTVARVLGTRHLVQGVAEITCWPRWGRMGSMVDATHALTGLALAASEPEWRRAALTDTAVTTAFCLVGWPSTSSVET